jgi:hypothetical protein
VEELDLIRFYVRAKVQGQAFVYGLIIEEALSFHRAKSETRRTRSRPLEFDFGIYFKAGRAIVQSTCGEGSLMGRHKLQCVGVFWSEGSGKHLQVGELLVHRGPTLRSHLP